MHGVTDCFDRVRNGIRLNFCDLLIQNRKEQAELSRVLYIATQCANDSEFEALSPPHLDVQTENDVAEKEEKRIVINDVIDFRNDAG